MEFEGLGFSDDDVQSDDAGAQQPPSSSQEKTPVILPAVNADSVKSSKLVFKKKALKLPPQQKPPAANKPEVTSPSDDKRPQMPSHGFKRINTSIPVRKA